MNVLRSRMALLGWAAGASLFACDGDVRDAGQAASAGAGAELASTSGAGAASSSTTTTGGAATTGGGVATTGGGGTPADGGAGGALEGGGPVTGGEGVACGEVVCGAGDQCLVCNPTDASAPVECVPEFTGNCAQGGGQYPPLRMTCDGHEDCAAAERCSLLEGSLGTYAQCADYCEEDCTSCFAQIVCKTLDDCPACATSCAPYQPNYVVSVCQW